MNKNMCALRHGYNQTLSSLPTANPLPLQSLGEAWVSAETKVRLPSYAIAYRGGAGALYARLRGILLDVRY